jgi:hypothetical protein
MPNNIVNWISPLGEVISFQICNYAGVWNDVGGVYMMCKFDTLQNRWLPTYIGQAERFKNRLPNHEQWLPSIRLGAQNVLAVVVPSKSKRDSLERMLIQRLNPPLNIQLKLPPLGLGILNYRS